MNYQFPKKTRNLALGMIAIGILAIVYGVLAHIDATRIWANVLVNALFFTFIALAGTFFLAIHHAGEAGWSASVKRIPEAMGRFLPVGGIILITVMIAASLHWNHIYHWMDTFITTEEVTVAELREYEEGQKASHGAHHETKAEEGHGHADTHGDHHGEVKEATVGDYEGVPPAPSADGSDYQFQRVRPEYYADQYEGMSEEKVIKNPHYDEIIAGKRPYLNQPFFYARTITYLLVWILFTFAFIRYSKKDMDPKKRFIKMRNMSGLFLVFFAITNSTSAWDWIMSIDTHWFSTLFGWYVFAGLFVTGIITIILTTIYLKKQGHLEQVNENHLHDLGKFMFAFSIFWTYLWFSQFMLIWYSNIPEEVTYFMDRWENYKFLWVLNLIVNFLFPFLVLMSRGAKRKMNVLVFAGVVLILGHWLDMFLMVMPGTVKANWGLGFLEIGMFLGFAGLFIYWLLNSLTKAPLVPEQHPFVDEADHHHV